MQFANAVGIDSGSFILDSGDCASGRSLFATTSCEVVVRFAPGTAGPKTASIQFATTVGAPATAVVPPLLVVSGTGIAGMPPPTLQLSASELRFADTVFGATAIPMELRLSNTGSRPLSVLALSTAAPFSVQARSCPSLPFVLLPGSDCTMAVSFQPQAQGDTTGQLAVTSDASAMPQQVALSAHAAPRADVSGGGCSLVPAVSATDPTLWALVLLAAAALLYRRRARRTGQRRSEEPGGEA